MTTPTPETPAGGLTTAIAQVLAAHQRTMKPGGACWCGGWPTDDHDDTWVDHVARFAAAAVGRDIPETPTGGPTTAEQLSDVIYADWPEDRYERLKFLERVVEEIVAAAVAQARAEALREFAEFIRNPVHAGLDDYTLGEVALEVEARADAKGVDR